MKKMLAFAAAVILVVTTGCSQTPKANMGDNNGPQIKFDTVAYDYGNVQLGGNGVHEFVFENTGTKPLVLSNVRSSCGCTIPEWPKDPIKSGEKASIKVKYDTRRVGPFSKSITVYSNAGTAPVVVLRIKGTVSQAAK